jgi:hypothetical protein
MTGPEKAGNPERDASEALECRWCMDTISTPEDIEAYGQDKLCSTCADPRERGAVA